MNAHNLNAVQCALPHLGYGKSYFNPVRAALNRAPKVYQMPANKIPACPEQFDRKFKTASNYAALGFSTLEAFSIWKTAVRGAFRRYARWIDGKPTQDLPYDDDWPKILSFVRDRAPGLGLVSTRAHLQFGAFIATAREDGLTPREVDTAFAQRAANRKSYGPLKQFRRGLAVWNALVGSDLAQAALPGLLPATPAEPPRKQASRARYKGWLPAEAPDALRADFAEFVRFKRTGDDCGLGDGLLGADVEQASLNFSDESARAYGYAVGWVFRTLRREGLIDAEDLTDLSDLLTHGNIRAAARIFQRERADQASIKRADASTLHCYVAKVTQIAIEYCNVSPAEERKLVALRKHPTVRTAEVGKMSAWRRRRIEAFANDMALQRRLLEAPDILMRESAARLRSWTSMTQHQRMRALKLGTAAAALAILLYGKPLRERNLRELRAHCDAPTLILPPDFKGRARFDLPGELTKNGKPIAGELDPEAMPILQFYFETVREKLISAHPFGKNHARSDFVFNSPRPDHATQRCVFAALMDEGLAFCGLDMNTHEMRHAAAFFVLDEDPNAIEEAAELLDDHPDTVRKFYAWINKRKAHQSARAKLRVARKKRLRGIA